MTQFDNTPEESGPPPVDPRPDSETPLSPSEAQGADITSAAALSAREPIDPSVPLAGDPIVFAGGSTPAVSAALNPNAFLPEDLRIS